MPSGQVIFGAQAYDFAIVIALAEAAHSGRSGGLHGADEHRAVGHGPCSTCTATAGPSWPPANRSPTRCRSARSRSTPSSPRPRSRYTVANLANGTFVVAQTIDVDLTALAAAQAAELAMAQALQTIRIQQALAALGLYDGPIDGQPNDQPLTASIVAQAQLGVPQTGVWDTETDAAAQAKLGTASLTLNAATKSLQQALTDLGCTRARSTGRCRRRRSPRDPCAAGRARGAPDRRRRCGHTAGDLRPRHRLGADDHDDDHHRARRPRFRRRRSRRHGRPPPRPRRRRPPRRRPPRHRPTPRRRTRPRR